MWIESLYLKYVNGVLKSMGSTAEYVVPFAEMRKFVCDCMCKIGTNPDHASQLADLLVAADERGHYSHGLNRLRIYMEDVTSEHCKGSGQPKVLKQKGATAWVDGDNALGVVVGNYCTDLAIKLAKENGIGWVVANNSNHYGIAAYYPLRMAKEKLVGMSFTNTSPLTFPNRCAQVGLGTNPLSVIASATNDDSFELDMATTAVALGKVELAERRGQSIPAGWAADSGGKITTDPVDVTQREGALLPLGGSEETGGYKGTGLSMMVELFCGIFGGAKFGKNVRTWREVSRVAELGQCFVAIDPDCFAPGFAERLQQFLDETRSLKPSDPIKPVIIPGDPERLNSLRSEKAGGLIYSKAQIEHLEEIAKKNSVSIFSYRTLE